MYTAQSQKIGISNNLTVYMSKKSKGPIPMKVIPETHHVH